MPIDFDKYGHCVVCHKNMIIKQIIDQKEKERFTSDYDETEYLLSDGSKMRVAICRNCKFELKEGHSDKIMKTVHRGWVEEVKGIEGWDDKKRDAYLNKYSKLKIVCKSDNTPEDVLNDRLSEFHKKEVAHVSDK
jgi:hypothetical protein